ncbi:unnamed protein product [Hymenolepis diminuta]|uniref:RRM domain-containing protein n=1 Tax=Hymenolepis diminuta TaxID=6216 RepID=A0A0R3SLF2_HYMDI|nr:unnamed protein product [Hymenolepis diminuta]
MCAINANFYTICTTYTDATGLLDMPSRRTLCPFCQFVVKDSATQALLGRLNGTFSQPRLTTTVSALTFVHRDADVYSIFKNFTAFLTIESAAEACFISTAVTGKFRIDQQTSAKRCLSGEDDSMIHEPHARRVEDCCSNQLIPEMNEEFAHRLEMACSQ